MPTAGLTPARVVTEAAAVADEVGLERLPLAAVAGRSGASLPSLDKHVCGPDGLRRDLAVLGLDELTAEMSRASVGTAGRDALHTVADAYRKYGRRRPGLVAAPAPAPAPAPDDEADRRTLDVRAGTLRAHHRDDDGMVDAIRSMRVVLHGLVTVESAGGFALPQSVDASSDRLVDGLDLMVSSWGGAAPQEPAR